jgi:hypothetical protein
MESPLGQLLRLPFFIKWLPFCTERLPFVFGMIAVFHGNPVGATLVVALFYTLNGHKWVILGTRTPRLHETTYRSTPHCHSLDIFIFVY